jgi:type IV pilus assembly protein PilK
VVSVVPSAGQPGWSLFTPLPGMDEEQFLRWAELIECRTGISLPPERKSFLVTNLGLRMREIGFQDFEAYYDHLQLGRNGAVEWATLVDRITVHETRFFRHPPSLDLVRNRLLPGVAADEEGRLIVKAWSVGCSTGEEPYTLAMVIDEYLSARRRDAYFGVIATDISLASVAAGRKGVYNERTLGQVSPRLRTRYFEPAEDGRYKVADRLRRRVCFAYLNSLETHRAPIGYMDLIYCQNMLIYFDRPYRQAIVAQLTDHLAPGGMLVLGPGELMGWSHPDLERVESPDTLAYRRVAGAPRGGRS